MDEMSQQEVATLSTFCELSDPELPLYLLRYVCLFCKSGGIFAMAECFEEGVQLEVGVAQAIIAIVCNLKVWLNYRSVAQLFVPLRSRVLRYLCNLSDKDLRLPAVKNMSGIYLSKSMTISHADFCFFLRFHVGIHEGSH
jgi:ubiquitin carboxyl-terminal hydrolase 34